MAESTVKMRLLVVVRQNRRAENGFPSTIGSIWYLRSLLNGIPCTNNY